MFSQDFVLIQFYEGRPMDVQGHTLKLIYSPQVTASNLTLFQKQVSKDKGCCTGLHYTLQVFTLLCPHCKKLT